jgi:hypothetical protein
MRIPVLRLFQPLRNLKGLSGSAVVIASQNQRMVAEPSEVGQRRTQSYVLMNSALLTPKLSVVSFGLERTT